MADISTVFLNNTTYNIKDATARNGLTNVYTKSEVDDIVDGIVGISLEVVASLPASGNAGTIYLVSNSGTGQNIYDEYVWLTASSRWEKIGTTDVDLSGYAKTADLGDLAFKDSASGSFTPAGSVTVNAYTPEGSVSAPTITVTPSTDTVNSITAVGTLPTWSASVTNEVLSFSFSQGTLPTKGANQTVLTGASATASAPTFRGTAKAPTGSFSGTAGTVSVS